MLNNSTNLQESISSVRRRLWLLLLRAFGVVVLLIVLFMLAATFIFLGSQTNRNPYYQAPMAYLLMSYYQGHGSWQGVEELLDQQDGLDIPYLRSQWEHSLLLDPFGRIVVVPGQSVTFRTGQLYPVQPGDTRISLVAQGETVGFLVIQSRWISTPLGLGLELLPPIAMTSILLGLLTLVIGLLLMRRVVNPLAEVIAAAQCVAGGDFQARVPLQRRHDDLYALSASFNQMAAALQRNDEQRRAMLADVAHELRTPLTILRGRLEGILDGIYPPDEAHIAPVLEEVYLLDRLVDDLRLLTLAEARQLPMESRAFDLEELAKKVVGTFEAEAAELGIQLTGPANPGGENSPDSRYAVLADPQRVEQVISNLIGNALRYVPTGGNISVKLNGAPEQISLTVADNGPGVDKVDLPYLFDRFWRGEKSRGRATGGSGLGLTIAKQLIDAMGGQIWARNRTEGGLEVGFHLPPV